MKNKLEKFRKSIIVGTISLVLLCAIGVSYAWYTGMDDVSATKEGVEVMTPYFLYLLNPGTTDSLQYTIGNIHPAETKQTVICVSNKKPDDVLDDSIDIARVSDFSYELEFITTNNLEVIYELYELKMHELADGESLPTDAVTMPEVTGVYWTKVGSALVGEDTSEERHKSVFGDKDVSDVVNRGSYTLYSKDSNGEDLHLVYSEDEYDYNYYLIEVNWIDETSFEKSLKETDVNYVVVNAKQPKPVEEEETQTLQENETQETTQEASENREQIENQEQVENQEQMVAE